MKQDKEPAISLPVYFKSVQKWKYVLRKNKKKKQKGQKKKKVSNRESPNPDLRRVRSMLLIYCTSTTNIEDSR